MRAARLYPGGIALGTAALFVGAAFAPDAPPPPAGPGFDGPVKVAFKEQASLLKSREHCSADPDELRRIGRGVGQQVRVYRGTSDLALFTVSEGREESPEDVLRMAKAARGRLGVEGDFAAHVVATAPHPTLSDAEAKAAGEFVERLDGDAKATGLLLMAPHGGDIERSTDLQAERVLAALAGKPVAAWRCKGYTAPGGPSASSRWHITATDTSEASFPKLALVARRRFRFVVSFHGMAREGVLIGGAGPMGLKAEVKAAIEAALKGSDIPVTIAAPDDAIGGHDPRNIVNRYCEGTGIQIEQSSRARRDHWRPIADAVARVYAGRLRGVLPAIPEE